MEFFKRLRDYLFICLDFALIACVCVLILHRYWLDGLDEQAKKSFWGLFLAVIVFRRLLIKGLS